VGGASVVQDVNKAKVAPTLGLKLLTLDSNKDGVEE